MKFFVNKINCLIFSIAIFFSLLNISLWASQDEKEARRFSIYKDIKFTLENHLRKNASLLNSSIGENVAVVIGTTGSGKSTLINYLSNKKLKLNDDEELELQNPDDPTAMKIGSGSRSETQLPKYVNLDSFILYDLPGFNDNRGTSINLLNASFIKHIIENAKTTRLIFVAGQDEITANRGDSFKKLIEITKSLLPQSQAIEQSSILIITKSIKSNAATLLNYLEQKFNNKENFSIWLDPKRIAPMSKKTSDEQREDILQKIIDLAPLRINYINIEAIYDMNVRSDLKEILSLEMSNFLEAALRKCLQSPSSLKEINQEKQYFLSTFKGDILLNLNSSPLINLLKSLSEKIFSEEEKKFLRNVKHIRDQNLAQLNQKEEQIKKEEHIRWLKEEEKKRNQLQTEIEEQTNLLKEETRERKKLQFQIEEQIKQLKEEKQERKQLQSQMRLLQLQTQQLREIQEKLKERKPKKIFKGHYGTLFTAYLMQDDTVRVSGKTPITGTATDIIFYPQTISFRHSLNKTIKIKDIYGGYLCAFALTEEGRVYSWGRNTHGELGHGHTNDLLYAESIPFFDSIDKSVKKIIMPRNVHHGYNSAYFLTYEGILYATGYNGHGQLGTSDTKNSSLPVRCGKLEDIEEVMLSMDGSPSVYAVDKKKQLWVWGYNNLGQLGIGNAETLTNPSKVDIIGVKKVHAMGGFDINGRSVHSAALILLENGTIYSAGWNGHGQGGVSHTTDSKVFKPLSLNFNRHWVKKIKMGGGYYSHCALIDAQGQLFMWGYNGYGQLGVGDTNNRTQPTLVSNLDKVKKVKLGGDRSYGYTIVLTENNELWGCGYNGYGQLGLGDTQYRTSFHFIPTPWLKENTRIKKVKLVGYWSQSATLVLTTDDAVWATGSNDYYQCGTHQTTSALSTFKQVVFQ